MPTNPESATPTFESVRAEDFETLLILHTAAMRPSLERVGRFDPERSRQRLRDSFYPEHTQIIVHHGDRVGFYTFRPEADYFKLNHLYILPGFQSQGLGATLLNHLIAIADTARKSIRLTALRESAANRFYQRHGFVAHSEEEWNINYERLPRT
jgi:GNAT superfamily N-acetyltransferase